MTVTNNILDVLIKLAPLVKLLAELEPVDVADLPKEYANDLKQLENLGLVFRRNSRSCALQKQRLLKLIERETRSVSSVKREMCFSAYSSVLQLKENAPASDSQNSELPNALCT